MEQTTNLTVGPSNGLMLWARREIDLATKPDPESDNPPEMNEEINKHYEAAFQAFCAFLEFTEKLKKPGIAKTVFTQLLNEDPLTPIEENVEEDWILVGGFDPAAGNENPGFSMYRNRRRATLFKKVTYDRKTGEEDEVKYTDSGRYICMDINTNEIYSGGMGSLILDEMMPITFPYSPIGKIKIFTEDFKAFQECEEDFDTIGVLYMRDTTGKMIEIKRFFKKDHMTKDVVEINVNEYMARKKKWTEANKAKNELNVKEVSQKTEE